MKDLFDEKICLIYIHKYRLHQSEIPNALSGLEKRGERGEQNNTY